MTPRRRTAVALSAATLALWFAFLSSTARADDTSTPIAQEPLAEWPAEVLEAFATIPVQDGGRVKPLDTFAGFTLLRMNHKRSCKTPDGRRLTALAWILDVLLRPTDAEHYTMFVVQDGAVLDAIGLSEARGEKKKRDRYSYAELAPARPALSQLASTYAGIDANKRSAVEAGVLKLAHDVAQFEWLRHYLEFARSDYDVSADALSTWFAGADSASLGEIIPHLPALRAVARGTARAPAVARLLEDVSRRGTMARAIALIPPVPSETTDGRWLTPADLIRILTAGGRVPAGHGKLLALLEDVTLAANQSVPLIRASQALRAEVRTQAAPYVDVDKIDLEVFLYRFDPFFWSLILFLFAFVLVAITWLKPSKWLDRGAWTLLLLGLALTTTGIVLRCVLRGRPPISTLYETVLFVTAFFVAGALLTERLNRQRIALSLAPILGALGLFVAGRYEVGNGQDTMPQLVAVLDTNFWLATHVTCITIGYAAGLLCSAMAHVSVLGQVFGLRRGDRAFYANVARMVMGMLAFALIFSIVGTILGGIWANESWGRFWGWDPKENGALLIVLSQLMIMHARMGGYLKPYGVALACVFQGCVVAFSWWHVNLLGIGLHSYGFTAGVMRGLMIFYAVEGAVLMTGLAWAFHRRWRARAQT